MWRPQSWCEGICAYYPEYRVVYIGLGEPPPRTPAKESGNQITSTKTDLQSSLASPFSGGCFFLRWFNEDGQPKLMYILSPLENRSSNVSPIAPYLQEYFHLAPHRAYTSVTNATPVSEVFGIPVIPYYCETVQ